MKIQVFPIVCLLPLSLGWGNLAHRTIALLAQKHFTPNATFYVNSLLGSRSLSSAAIWADTYKLLPRGWHTSSWHYINAADDPPHTCRVSYPRECPATRMCIISAIMSATNGVNDSSLKQKERTKALKFLLHLLGDLHCPLHVEGLLKGGNDIPVHWDRKETNLHFVWDVLIPQRWTNSSRADEEKAAVEWAERLYNASMVVSAGSSGVAKQPLRIVNEGLDLRENAESLVLKWAGEANAWVCQMVLRDGVDGVKGKELSGTYYEEAIPVLEELILNAGLRLAAWINELAKEEALERIEDVKVELK